MSGSARETPAATPRALVLVLVLAVALTGCSQGVRRDHERAIRTSVPQATGQTISGTFSLALQPVEITGARQVELRTGTLAAVTFAADPGARLSALQVKPGGPTVYITNGRSLFARRATRQTNQRRPWARLDVKRTDRGDRLATPSLVELIALTGPGNASVVDPQLLIDLLSGALTGSIERGERLPDETTTYTFNVSIDKANRALRLNEDARKNRTKVLRSLAITEDVHAATARLRPDGSLSRFSVIFTQRPDKQAALALTAALDVQPSSASTQAASAVLVVPDRAATVRVASLGDIGAALAQRLVAP